MSIVAWLSRHSVNADSPLKDKRACNLSILDYQRSREVVVLRRALWKWRGYTDEIGTRGNESGKC